MKEKEKVDMNQTQRSLKTEELYREVLDLVCESVFEEYGETYVRGKLDAILSMGKIEGRLTAHNVYGVSISPYGDRLIDGWQRIVEAD